MFRNREEAGFALAQKLSQYKDTAGVVLAVPKGGVPIGYVVAGELNLPLELVLSKKIGHPMNKEYAIGAVSLLGSFVVPHDDVTEAYIDRETTRIKAYLEEMQNKYMSNRPPVNLAGKTVIVIDDGIATGNTLLATIQILKKNHPRKLVIAVPVTSGAAKEMLKGYVDEIISLITPEYFEGVGAYYDDFSDVSEEEVIECLEKNRQNHAVKDIKSQQTGY